MNTLFLALPSLLPAGLGADQKEALVNLAYLIASIFFILGLKGLGHPRTAVKGNLFGALAMLIAVVVTLAANEIISWQWIIVGLAAGSIIGIILAVKIEMTSMPQLVAIFNGFGGGASALVAGAALIEAIKENGGENLGLEFSIATVASGLIGAVTFWGSLIAFGKLQGLVSGQPIQFPGNKFLNAMLLFGSIALCVMIVQNPGNAMNYWIMLGVASVLGILLVTPIGGADMPVVIALLNSYSGLAAAATGFVLHNNVLIISGSLVGASGLILTKLMCKAMNRSLANVLFGGVGAIASGPAGSDDEVYAGKVKSTSADEVAMLLDTAQRVVVVPGYGLAVAQAQHAVKDLADLLEAMGKTVEFAIHPVAGRMPGHMNVLLAEADIPYDRLIEMDTINPTFSQVDLTIVVGANDVINPLAREDSNSPIAGMPILDVDKSHTVVVVKRSLSPGFAGIANPLFAADNCLMFFADGKKAITDLVAEVKDL